MLPVPVIQLVMVTAIYLIIHTVGLWLDDLSIVQLCYSIPILKLGELKANQL